MPVTGLGDKASLRAAVLARRAAVDEAIRRDLALRLAELGPNLCDIGTELNLTTASVFLPIRGEPDTHALIGALHAAGLRTALPVTPARGQRLRFHLWRPGDPLWPGTWRIPEPSADSPEVDPDILFVPLAAFDRRGHRLGYGAGFYDNALAALRRSKPVRAIGIAFATQEVEAVPTEPHDEALDAIVTERDVIFCKRSEGHADPLHR